MKLKKILWMAIFIVIIVAFIILIENSTHQEEKELDVQNIAFNNSVNKTSVIISDNPEPYKEKQLDDGILYTLDENSDYKADIILKDKYFDTTIRDMNLNSSDYIDKIVEIEGLYFNNGYYSFVGRYTTSNLCPTCPPGYSFMEFHFIY